MKIKNKKLLIIFIIFIVTAGYLNSVIRHNIYNIPSCYGMYYYSDDYKYCFNDYLKYSISEFLYYTKLDDNINVYNYSKYKLCGSKQNHINKCINMNETQPVSCNRTTSEMPCTCIVYKHRPSKIEANCRMNELEYDYESSF